MLILVIRTLILYGTVIASMRVMGKRQIGELQPSELVVAIMISDLAAVPMQAIDIPILTGIIPVLTLIVAEVTMSFISAKSKLFRKIVTGEPSVVIYDGHINEKELSKLRLNIDDLMEELRLINYHDISDINVAIIETSGKLSVIPKTNARNVTVEDMSLTNLPEDGVSRTLVTNGQLDKKQLELSGKSEKWLKDKLKQQGIKNISEVFLASVNAQDEVFVQKVNEEDKK